MRCFILNRVSSEKQARGMSLEVQRELHPRIADELGCTYSKADIFDLGVSSTTFDHKNWDAIKEAIASGKYEGGYGIFGAIDRFHRDKVELFSLITYLLRFNIKIAIPDTDRTDFLPSERIPIKTFNADQFKDLIQLVFEIEEAENFKKKLRSRVKRSLSHARSIGIDIGATGLPTLGYTWDSKRQVNIGGRGYGKWVVNPNQKELVRKIFTSPLSNVQMAILLNKEGFHNTLGASFDTVSISRIRKRLRYAGKMRNDNGDIIDALNVEPIVTYEEYESVQRHGKKTKEYRGRGAKYKMIGLVKCGLCIENGLKGIMVRKAWKAARIEQARLYCDSTRYLVKPARCPAFSKGVASERIFTLTIADLSKKMNESGFLAKSLNDYKAKLSKINNVDGIAVISKRVLSLEKKIQNLTRAVADGFDRSAAIKELNRINSEKEKLIQEKTEMQIVSGKKDELPSARELRNTFNTFFQNNMAGFDEPEINTILKIFIESIRYYIDHIIIIYRFFPPSKIKTPYLDSRFKENRSPRYKVNGKDPVPNLYPINNVRIKGNGK